MVVLLPTMWEVWGLNPGCVRKGFRHETCAKPVMRIIPLWRPRKGSSRNGSIHYHISISNLCRHFAILQLHSLPHMTPSHSSLKAKQSRHPLKKNSPQSSHLPPYTSPVQNFSVVIAMRLEEAVCFLFSFTLCVKSAISAPNKTLDYNFGCYSE